MTRHFMTLLLAGVLASWGGAAVASPPPVILEADEAEESVTVDDIRFEGNRLSGVIVNREPHPLRDVRLVIGHVYRWPSEFRPGEESPNQAETVVVEREIPAEGRTAFSTTFRKPDPPRPGGEFVTRVYVLGFTEVILPERR